jgi:hypothetical protein
MRTSGSSHRGVEPAHLPRSELLGWSSSVVVHGLGDQGFPSPPDVKEFPVHNLQIR